MRSVVNTKLQKCLQCIAVLERARTRECDFGFVKIRIMMRIHDANFDFTQYANPLGMVSRQEDERKLRMD